MILIKVDVFKLNNNYMFGCILIRLFNFWRNILKVDIFKILVRVVKCIDFFEGLWNVYVCVISDDFVKKVNILLW